MEGGVGAFTREIAREFSKNGNEVHIITSRLAKPPGADRSLWDIKEPYDLGYAQLHARINRWWWPDMSTIAQIADRFDLQLINIQYQAAAYDMNIPAINFLPWRLRELSKTVVTFHDLRVPYLFPKAGWLRRKVLHRLAYSADGVIATNAEDFALLLKLGVEPARMTKLPIGSNIAAHEPDRDAINKVRSENLERENGVLLGYFGFLNESKGADLLVETLSKLPAQFELVFIGGQTGSSDTSKNRRFLKGLKDEIEELDIDRRVHWSGFLEEEEVSTYLHACDIVVMPYRDGVSLRRGTLMAALAHGRPIITTEPSRPAEPLAHGENVWMTPADDSANLQSAVVHLSDHPDIRSRLGRGAKMVSQQFTWPEIASDTESFYRTIIEQKG